MFVSGHPNVAAAESYPGVSLLHPNPYGTLPPPLTSDTFLP